MQSKAIYKTLLIRHVRHLRHTTTLSFGPAHFTHCARAIQHDRHVALQTACWKRFYQANELKSIVDSRLPIADCHCIAVSLE